MIAVQHEPFRSSEIHPLVPVLGQETVGERVPFAKDAGTGIEVTILSVITQSQIRVEGMTLNELRVMAFSTGPHG